MMQWWNTAIDNVQRIVSSMKIGDVAEILIIAVLVYHIIIWIQKSRAWYLLKGLIVILAFILLAYILQMNTILWIGVTMAPTAVTAIVVVLQPEIRKALEELGKRNVLAIPFESGSKKVQESFSEKSASEIVRACVEMGKVCTGALIVVEKKDSLADYERTGIDVDAVITSQMLINIFEHNTPLHDGAVLIRHNRISSATCYLPLSDNMDLSKDLGTRHRAGVGISEVTDAVTVIVSEETGNISVACNGVIEKITEPERLRQWLLSVKESSEEEKGKHKWKGKSKDKK